MALLRALDTDLFNEYSVTTHPCMYHPTSLPTNTIRIRSAKIARKLPPRVSQVNLASALNARPMGISIQLRLNTAPGRSNQR